MATQSVLEKTATLEIYSKAHEKLAKQFSKIQALHELIVLLQMELITSTDVVRNLCKKMAPPEPEIQYVALRNINLIVQKRPTIFAHEIKAKDVVLAEKPMDNKIWVYGKLSKDGITGLLDRLT